MFTNKLVCIHLGSPAIAMHAMASRLSGDHPPEEYINALNAAIGDDYLLNTTLETIGVIAARKAHALWGEIMREEYHITIVSTYARSIWLGIRTMYPTYIELRRVLMVGPAHYDYVLIHEQSGAL